MTPQERARNFSRKKRAEIHRLKEVPCADCGKEFPYYVMDFDHREGEIKLFSIGNRTTLSGDKLMAEIAKCDIVCANCHRIRTHERRL
jgi:hypothetical protein